MFVDKSQVLGLALYRFKMEHVLILLLLCVFFDLDNLLVQFVVLAYQSGILLLQRLNLFKNIYMVS